MTSLSLTNPEREEAFYSDRRKWLLIGPGLLAALVLCVYGCARAVQRGAREAYVMANDFHAAMARQDWDGIYDQADPGYQSAVSRQDSSQMFSGIARKLGSPLNCKQGGTIVSANTSGNTIETECETQFSSGANATETFVWRKSLTQYRLFGYHITSAALLTK